MEWKDSAEMADNEASPEEEFFDEDQYPPWNERRKSKGWSRLNRPPVLLILLLLAIVALVAALVMLVWGGNTDATTRLTLTDLENRVHLLEERLDKYETIDEKVTRIWEQAKSFEKFQDRFERNEASTTLRMDHLTVSLEALQKQMAQLKTVSAAPAPEASAPSASSALHYHQVAAGETFYSISKIYSISVEQLLRLNKMTKDDVLMVGQKLIIGNTADKK